MCVSCLVLLQRKWRQRPLCISIFGDVNVLKEAENDVKVLRRLCVGEVNKEVLCAHRGLLVKPTKIAQCEADERSKSMNEDIS
jgi:hypothetical protein